MSTDIKPDPPVDSGRADFRAKATRLRARAARAECSDCRDNLLQAAAEADAAARTFPDATPAPLDPDEVEELRIPVARMLTGDTLVAWATVEANEPPTVYVRRKKTAPEPEPEWKPGTVAEGTVNGKTVRGLIGHNDNNDGDVFVYWNKTARHVSLTGTVPDDVRPLVVIDPADVDVDALNEAALSAYHLDSSVMTADGVRAAVGAVLAKLGIEAP